MTADGVPFGFININFRRKIMKKKLLALSACCALALALTGCQAALVSSEVTMEKSGAGKKTITAVIYGDDSILAGKTSTEEEGNKVGNNSKYLLVSGTALENKVKSYSALEGIEVKATPSGGDTVLTLSYSFTSIEDYNTKTKTLAKDQSTEIEDATFTENTDGSYTYKENCDNTQYSIDNLFLSLWNDSEAFDKTGKGDCDLEANNCDYTCIYTIMSVSATVGDKTQTVEINKYDENNTVVELDYPDYLEVTGKFVAVPPKEDDTKDDGETKSNTGLIIGLSVAGGVVVIGGVVAAIVIAKKKKA